MMVVLQSAPPISGADITVWSGGTCLFRDQPLEGSGYWHHVAMAVLFSYLFR